MGRHREAAYAHHGFRLALVHAFPNRLKNLVSDEILTSTAGVDVGLDQVLRHILVVGQQLLDVLERAVTAIAKARVVVVTADSRLQAHININFVMAQVPPLQEEGDPSI